MGQADFCPMGGNIMMQAVIMAGGKGTRLAALTKDEIPKPMVPVAGKPLLLWQVERLKENEITDIIMVIGHLGDKIKECEKPETIPARVRPRLINMSNCRNIELSGVTLRDGACWEIFI